MFAPSQGRAFARTVESWVGASHRSRATTTAAAGAARAARIPRIATSPLTPLPCMCARAFSATTAQQSKLGRTPLSVPPGVDLMIGEPIVQNDPTTHVRIPRRTVTVEGPLGKLHLLLPPFVHLDHDAEGRQLTLAIENRELKKQKQMWGTTWALLKQHIIGVSEGHTAVLRLVGVGYRASVEQIPAKEEYPGQKFVVLKLGFSHTVDMGVPLGVTASAPQQTRVLLEGIDREKVMSFAASIRKWRKPEPYKGKGIFVNDETIKIKQKKIK